MQFLPWIDRRLRWGAVLLCLCASFAFCRKADSQNDGRSSEINAELRGIITSGNLEDLRWPDFSDYKTILISFYEPSRYAPSWLQSTRPTPQALSMIELFRSAWKKGLDPEDYDASRWDTRVHTVQGSDNALARFDAALTICTMRFVSDLRIGRINPKHFKFGLNVEQKKYDLAKYVRDRLLPANDLSAVLEGIEPPFPGYRRTEAASIRYAELVRTDDKEKMPVPTKTIDPGTPYPGVPRLTRLLGLLGDMPRDAKPSTDPQVYDGSLVDAGKHFQRRHGLNDDGRLGSETVKQLNVPISDRVHQLQLPWSDGVGFPQNSPRRPSS